MTRWRCPYSCSVHSLCVWARVCVAVETTATLLAMASRAALFRMQWHLATLYQKPTTDYDLTVTAKTE